MRPVVWRRARSSLSCSSLSSKSLEVELRRVLHQFNARGVGEALGEERVDERDHAPEDVGEDGQRQLEEQQRAEAMKETAREPH